MAAFASHAAMTASQEDEILCQEDLAAVFGSQSVLTQEMRESIGEQPIYATATLMAASQSDNSGGGVVDTSISKENDVVEKQQQLKASTPGKGLRSLLAAATAIKTPPLRHSPRLLQRQQQQKARAVASKSKKPTKHKKTKQVAPEPALTTTSASASAAKKKSSYRKPQPLSTPQRLVAQQAAQVVQRVTSDQKLAKKLLLRMALEREKSREPPPVLPPRGHEVPSGFTWAHYPPLERVLRDEMAEYYRHSIGEHKQAQQDYNNQLCDMVLSSAAWQGWSFVGDRKHLRNRIRCYYKTHIQNAKKRLNTMLKSPCNPRNAKALVSHWDLMADLVEKKGGEDSASSTSSLGTMDESESD